MSLQQVFDKNGQPKDVGDLVAKPGGEGSVYMLRDKQGILVKIYHPEKLQLFRSEYQAKIEAMVSLKDQFTNIDVCWPLLPVYDDAKQWIGYAMRQGNGKTMLYLAHAMLYKRHFPNLDRIALCLFLKSFVKNIKALHKRNVFVGDYNLSNFLCNPETNTVTMIDCDSYQVCIDDKLFPCPVGSPDLTPVEHHNKNFKQIKRTVQSEAFSLAIIIFKCLMLGRHPYDIVGGDDPVTNLQRGNFPYGKGNYGIPKGPWYNIWSHMPYSIKSMFIQTFTEGATDPSKRASIADWASAINTYLEDMKRGYHETSICPEYPKASEYRGKKQITERRSAYVTTKQ